MQIIHFMSLDAYEIEVFYHSFYCFSDHPHRAEF